jgi:pyruvate/2-oxoglutarate dehydrogenase complex dihydrolipoamide acyltransferase (E2) component
MPQAGLVTAIYARCDTGKRVLHYLATGENGGDSQLDVLLSRYVGVPLPQARAIADQQIQQCDTDLSKQEAAQASAAAASQAAASAAAAAAKQTAAIQAEQQRSCAAIGGRVDAEWGWCASTVKGNPSGNPGAECENANVAFNTDGSIADYAYTTDKDFYPSCFR